LAHTRSAHTKTQGRRKPAFVFAFGFLSFPQGICVCLCFSFCHSEHSEEPASRRHHPKTVILSGAIRALAKGAAKGPATPPEAAPPLALSPAEAVLAFLSVIPSETRNLLPAFAVAFLVVIPAGTCFCRCF